MKDCWKKNKYTCGKIYKILCNTSGLCYYGSTTQSLHRRLQKHESVFNIQNDNLTAFKVLDNNNYHIELVEKYPCFEKNELVLREAFYIKHNECVNKVIPSITLEEKLERNRKYNVEYRIINKERNAEYNKQKSKIRCSMKIMCQCGIDTSLSNKARHEKTRHHIENV